MVLFFFLVYITAPNKIPNVEGEGIYLFAFLDYINIILFVLYYIILGSFHVKSSQGCNPDLADFFAIGRHM